MRTATGNAQVTIGTRPLWRIRIAREWPRYLMSALAFVGIAASTRFAIDPPRAVISRVVARGPVAPDLAGEGYAARFARDYLTWNAADPQARESDLAAFAGPGIDPGAGLQPPSSGEQRVEWAEVVQVRELASARGGGPGEHVYTVAAQTDDAGLQYLTVPVVRTAGEAWPSAAIPRSWGRRLVAPHRRRRRGAKSKNRRS